MLKIKSKIQSKFHWRKLNKLAKKQDETLKLVDKAVAFELCPSDYTPIKKGKDAGKLSKFNDDLYAVGMLIAIQDKYNPVQKGISKHYNISTINNVVNHALTCGSAVLISHNEVKILPDAQAVMLKKLKKKNDMVNHQVKMGQAKTSNAMANQNSTQNNKNHTNIALDGDDFYSWVCLPCVVFSPSIEKLKADLHNIETVLLKGGIRYIIPKFNQKAVIQAAIPFSSQTNVKFLQRINGRTVASLIPFRNPHGTQPKEGFIFAVDVKTGRPMKIHATPKDPEHTFIAAPTSSGKTVLICNMAGNALALGYDVILIEPKNEDSDGSDYINFVEKYNGSISRWGADEGCISPCPLIIYYNEKKMGTDPASYRKAKDDHFFTVQNEYKLLKGGLNERQSGMITSTLIKLFIERGIIDEEGNPKNTNLWTKPGALNWPSIHEHRLYMKKEFGDPNSEYYKDPSLKAFLDSTMNCEPGGTLWWWANSKQFFEMGDSSDGSLKLFDISQAPDTLQSVIAIQIMGICNTLYYPKKNDGTPRTQTLLIFDEIKKLCNTKEFVPYMERALNEGRAPGITWIGATQKPLPDKELMDTIRANCRNIIILDNLKPQNIDLYLEAFKIPDKYRSKLMKVGKGVGVYFRDLLGTEISVELDEMLEDAVLNSTRGMIANNSCATVHGIEVEKYYKEIFEKEEMFITTWLSTPKQQNYPGYKNYTPYDPIGHGGSLSAYVKKSKITEHDELKKDGKKRQDIIDNEGEVHFVSVCRIAGWMRRHGFPNVEINHVLLPDITWGDKDENGNYIKNERYGCLEYEGKGTHDKDEWDGKLKRAREHGYKIIIFTGHSLTCKEMMKEESHVRAFVYQQGEENLLRKLEDLADMYISCNVNNPSIESTYTDATEVC